MHQLRLRNVELAVAREKPIHFELIFNAIRSLLPSGKSSYDYVLLSFFIFTYSGNLGQLPSA